ncbi:MAG: 50S ribosomal protein L33 [Patescibacteria group bacterium]
MAQSVFSKNLVKLKCSACKRIGYYAHKNVKRVEKKLALSKYCKWCRKHTEHKEAKR